MATSQPVTLKVQKPAEPDIGIIQGQIPDSRNEWFVALALEKLKRDYIYQYSLGGGSRLRGGVIVDFIVYGAPATTALFVGAGGYYHSKSREESDILAHSLAAHYFGDANVKDIRADESDTFDSAFDAVRKLFA